MADIKKFLDQQGVSTLWNRVATKLNDEKVRAEAAEKAAADAAKKAQDDIEALSTYVGTIPADYTESNVIAYINKKAEETLNAASGGSSESAASVLAALNTYKGENDPKVQKNKEDIADIVADYLKAADKEELAGNIATNASEITRIDNALKAAVENDGEGLDSIKELATWIEEHGADAAGYAAAIAAIEALVGNEAVATQIANAIAKENLAQYAKSADIEGTLAKVDTQGTVSEAISAAIDAVKIGDYAKAADLTALAARVSTLETAGYQNASQVTDAINNAIAALKLSETYEAKGAAATAEANAKAYADGLAANYDAAGSAASAEAAAKAYTDTEINTKVIALTTAEIDSAIASATV